MQPGLARNARLKREEAITQFDFQTKRREQSREFRQQRVDWIRVVAWSLIGVGVLAFWALLVLGLLSLL